MKVLTASAIERGPTGRGSDKILRRWRRRLFPGNSALISGSIILAVSLCGAVWSLFLGGAINAQDLRGRLAPPIWAGGTMEHVLGTDSLGRDILFRIMDGARTSLTIAVLAVTLAMVFGVVVGLIAGYFGGWVDAVLMRFADAVLSIPVILLALTTIAIIGGGVTNLILVIAFAQWMAFARNTRGETMVYREMLFTMAAKSLGAHSLHIIRRHVLPHTIPVTIVLATLSISSAILLEAGLSFLGIGVQPPDPSLGAMLSEGRDYMSSAPWLAILPGLAIFVLVLGVNLLGDGLRVFLDRRNA